LFGIGGREDAPRASIAYPYPARASLWQLNSQHKVTLMNNGQTPSGEKYTEKRDVGRLHPPTSRFSWFSMWREGWSRRHGLRDQPSN